MAVPGGREAWPAREDGNAPWNGGWALCIAAAHIPPLRPPPTMSTPQGTGSPTPPPLDPTTNGTTSGTPLLVADANQGGLRLLATPLRLIATTLIPGES